jgi:hypothetical protein
MWTGACRNTKCRAVRDLGWAYDALFGRDTPNSMARLPGSYERDLVQYNATLRRLGSAHPDRLPLYCALLADIARRDDDYRDLQSDWRVTLWTVELATRITTRRFDCIGQIMQAFPQNPAMDSRLRDTQESCRIDRYPLCDRITRPSMQRPPAGGDPPT